MNIFINNNRGNTMRKLLVSVMMVMLVIINGLVSVKFIEKNKHTMKEMLDVVVQERDELKLQLKEYEQNGIEVDVTMYHPVTQQTDATPDILADGTRIKITKASEYKFIAVSRNLLKRWGGALNFGDFVLLRGTKNGAKDGVYQVRDVMNARFVNRIDVLESPGAPPYKFTDANIVKLDWVSTNK